MKQLLSRAHDKYYRDGFVNLLQASGLYILNTSEQNLKQIKWRVQYHPNAVPKCGSSYNVPISKIKYIVHNSRLRDVIGKGEQCEILSGEWDLIKEPLKDTYMYESMYERLVENRSWEQTEYYDIIKNTNNDPYSSHPYPYNGGSIAKIDNPLEWLEPYEELYIDIKSNGYDESYPIKVHIGRNGEYIIRDGCHRAIISHICDVESIPVKVCIRHKDWQDIRDETANQEIQIMDHPDITEML